MKLEVTRTVEKRETIEIQFPYYYKHDLLLDQADHVIYGKIEKNKCTRIALIHAYGGGREFSIEFKEISAERLGCYMTDEYKSNESEYLDAKAELLAAALHG